MRHVSKPVRKVPMATPIKKERKINFSPGGFFAYLRHVFAFIKRRFILCSILFSIIGLLVVIFATPLFSIQTISYDFTDSVQECVSESTIRDAYFKNTPKIWSHYFFDEHVLKDKYPCLDSISFSWNLFSFNSLSVGVISAKPVAMVTVTRIDLEDTSGLSEKAFVATSLSEEVSYITKNGTFISFASPPEVPAFRYRIYKNQKLEKLRIDPKDVQTILQLHTYLQSELNMSSGLDLAQDGSIRFTAPFAEEIYVTLRDDLSIQLGSLQAILGTSTIDKKKIHLIDLRFGNPVIHFR